MFPMPTPIRDKKSPARHGRTPLVCRVPSFLLSIKLLPRSIAKTRFSLLRGCETSPRPLAKFQRSQPLVGLCFTQPDRSTKCLSRISSTAFRVAVWQPRIHIRLPRHLDRLPMRSTATLQYPGCAPGYRLTVWLRSGGWQWQWNWCRGESREKHVIGARLGLTRSAQAIVEDSGSERWKDSGGSERRRRCHFQCEMFPLQTLKVLPKNLRTLYCA